MTLEAQLQLGELLLLLLLALLINMLLLVHVLLENAALLPSEASIQECGTVFATDASKIHIIQTHSPERRQYHTIPKQMCKEWTEVLVVIQDARNPGIRRSKQCRLTLAHLRHERHHTPNKLTAVGVCEMVHVNISLLDDSMLHTTSLIRAPSTACCLPHL